jgi:osmoprotectant transport system ATP-binding protein
VHFLMDLVGLPPPEFLDRRPHALSGGQRQRVGVARALAADPPILLCDEAFGSVDPLTRVELRREFKALVDKLGKTVVFVTHDVREALALGDRIVLLERGQICFAGDAREFRESDLPAALALRELE